MIEPRLPHDPFLDPPLPVEEADGCLGVMVACFLTIVFVGVIFAAVTFGLAGHGG
jgi:hypothetical protein